MLRLLALFLLSTAPASAQDSASALLREGDTFPGAPAGHTVNSLSSAHANNAGGFAISMNSSSGSTTLSHAWGSANGTGPTVLQTEGMIGPLTQTSFESWLGIADDGSVCYSASGTGGPAGGFDSAWEDSTPLAVEGDPITALPGQFWRFASRPRMTADGQPCFVAGITSTSGGSTENRGFFLGSNPVPVLMGGDSVPGLPVILSTSSTVSFDYGISATGARTIFEVQMDTSGGVTSSDNNAMVLNGNALSLGGSTVREGTLVPVSIGGDGSESWDNFDYMAVNEAGDWFFSGDTDGPSSSDEILVQNGAIRFREGDLVDGWVLDGALEGAVMNEAGQLAYIWDVDDAGSSVEALFIEDSLVLREGDEVDWNGDGLVDPGHVITSFTGISSMAIDASGRVYFTADIDVVGSTLEGFFSVGQPTVGTAYCFGDGQGTPCPCANSGAADGGCANGSSTDGGKLVASGSAIVSLGNFTLQGSRLVPGQPGLFFQGDNALNGGNGSIFGDGLRCAGGNIVRLEIVSANGAGESSTTLDVPAAGGVSVGETKRYQLWYRDPSGSPCGSAFNLTNGLEVLWL